MKPSDVAEAIEAAFSGPTYDDQRRVLFDPALPSAPDHRLLACPIDGKPAGTLSGNCGHSWSAALVPGLAPDHRLRDFRDQPANDAANDVRASHAPNEYDSCVACNKTWPCDAELLAEMVLTRAVLSEATPTSEPDLDVERLSASVIEALNAVDDDWTADELTDLIAAEYRRLSASQPPEPDIQ